MTRGIQPLELALSKRRMYLILTLPSERESFRFVKHFRAHLSPILSLAVSADGGLAATIAADGTLLAAGGYKNDVKGSVKVFDIANFGKSACNLTANCSKL